MSPPSISFWASVSCSIFRMPVLDGLSATRAIRATEASTLSSRIRIVALTSNARKAQVETALESGMDSVVTKPCASSSPLPCRPRADFPPQRRRSVRSFFLWLIVFVSFQPLTLYTLFVFPVAGLSIS